MDISMAGLLSEILRMAEEEYGPHKIEKDIAREFSNTTLNNPLNELFSGDKAHLIALISCYEACGNSDSKMIENMERTARLIRDAGKLAARFQQEWDDGSFLSIEPVLERFSKDLQSRLSLFSTEVGKLFDQAGKKGHKHKSILNCILVTASEFIRIKTGTYNDEHFAELLQGRSSQLGSKELSGDAIRKKREHLQKTYPSHYKSALETAVRLSYSRRVS